MPIYEYRCDEGHETTLEQRITENPITHCLFYTDDEYPITSMCRATCHRLISKSSFVLRGGGWTAKSGGTKGC